MDGTSRKVSFVFVAALLAVVAVVGVTSLLLPLSPFIGVQYLTQPCAHPFTYPAANQTTLPNGTEITQAASPVFLMSPNSTMNLCVGYSSLSNGVYSAQAYNSVYGWKTDEPARNVKSTAAPAYLSLAEGRTTYVKYAVTAGQNATGFYGISLFQLCGLTPIAVGHESSQINSSDFPGLLGGFYFGCPPITLQAQIAGYDGANVTYLRSESRFNPTINITDVTVSSFPTSEGGENVTFRMNLQSFSRSITTGLSQNGSIVRVFQSNPDLTTLPVNDFCSWYADNQDSVYSMNITAFQDEPAGFMQVDAPVLLLSTYSNTTYTFSILIAGPIAKFTAIDPTLFVSVPGSPQTLYGIAAYFPVSISGHLQSVSGSCISSQS
jgi:hypothetical protein